MRASARALKSKQVLLKNYQIFFNKTYSLGNFLEILLRHFII